MHPHLSLLEVALTDSKIHRNGQYRAVKSTKILQNMSRKEALQLQSAKGPTIGCPARGFNGTTIGSPAFKNQNSFRVLCPLAGGCGRRRRAGRRTWGRRPETRCQGRRVGRRTQGRRWRIRSPWLPAATEDHFARVISLKRKQRTFALGNIMVSSSFFLSFIL